MYVSVTTPERLPAPSTATNLSVFELVIESSAAYRVLDEERVVP
jgi:hypothetical protein